MTKSQVKSVWVCPDYTEPTPDGNATYTNATAKKDTLTLYAINQYLSPNEPVGVPTLHAVALAQVDAPASTDLLSETLGDLGYNTGQDYLGSSTTTNAHSIGYMNARTRHNGGANYAFVDGHVKFFRAPATTMPAVDTARSTVMSWAKCTTGTYSNPAGYFFPIVVNPAGTAPAFPTGVSGTFDVTDACQ